MMVSRRHGLYNVLGMLAWQWKGVLLFASGGALAYLAHEYLGWYWLRLPTLPLTVVGAALGIFVSFRTNSSYDRIQRLVSARDRRSSGLGCNSHQSTRLP